MTPENFAYWLQGFSEICGETPTPEQWKIIQDHLNLVFRKETPVYLPIIQEQPPFYVDGYHPTFDQWKSFGEFGANPPTGEWPTYSC